MRSVVCFYTRRRNILTWHSFYVRGVQAIWCSLSKFRFKTWTGFWRRAYYAHHVWCDVRICFILLWLSNHVLDVIEFYIFHDTFSFYVFWLYGICLKRKSTILSLGLSLNIWIPSHVQIVQNITMYSWSTCIQCCRFYSMFSDEIFFFILKYFFFLTVVILLVSFQIYVFQAICCFLTMFHCILLTCLLHIQYVFLFSIVNNKKYSA